MSTCPPSSFQTVLVKDSRLIFLKSTPKRVTSLLKYLFCAFSKFHASAHIAALALFIFLFFNFFNFNFIVYVFILVFCLKYLLCSLLPVQTPTKPSFHLLCEASPGPSLNPRHRSISITAWHHCCFTSSLGPDGELFESECPIHLSFHHLTDTQ